MQSLQAHLDLVHQDLARKGFALCSCAYAPPDGRLTCGRCGHAVWWHREARPDGALLVFAGPDKDGQPQYVRAAAVACAKPLPPPELARATRPAEDRGITTAKPCRACGLPLVEGAPQVVYADGLANAACVKRLEDAKADHGTAGTVARCAYCGGEAFRRQLAEGKRGLGHEACRRFDPA